MVGYIITGVLGLGLLIALERLITLGFVGISIRSQLKNVGSPKSPTLWAGFSWFTPENKNIDVENPAQTG